MTDVALKSALVHWGHVGAKVTLIAARENHVYRVYTARGPLALRLHRAGYRSAAELQSELQWMQMLADGGITVPAPIRARDGSLFLTVDDTVIDLLSWVEGVPLSHVPDVENRPDLYRDLGRQMAQMHDLADRWSPPAGFARPAWDIDGLLGQSPLWGRFWDNPTLTTSQAARLADFCEVAREKLANTTDYGLVHADLVLDNVMISHAGLHPIDFDDGGFGYRLFDLATVTHRALRTAPDGTLGHAVIEGYTDLRAIDLTQLKLFEALRACTYVGWIITRMKEDGAQARNTRFITEAIARIDAL